MNRIDIDHERRAQGFPPCDGCGCNDETPCMDGCYWVEPSLCSSCIPPSESAAHLQPVPVRRVA